MAIILVMGYLVGYLLTLTFFTFFGKRMGIDYDTIKSYDDWPSNNAAYIGWSIAWPLTWVVGLVFGSFKLFYLFSITFMKIIKSKSILDK
jgi:hypothetical protein